MAIIQNDGKRERRRPSLKGGVMLDVVNGQERARGWPKKRGKNLHPTTKAQNEWFRQAQWATKFMAPEIYWNAVEAVKGSPLLPRDILTMMFAGRLAAFDLPDGRTIWSVQVASDVSQALDVLSQVPGAMLVRGEDGWQAILPGVEGQVLTAGPPGQLPVWGAGGGGGGMGLIAQHVCGVGENSFTLADMIPQDMKDLIIEARAGSVNASAGPSEAFFARFNNDSGNRYKFILGGFYPNSAYATGDNNATALRCGTLSNCGYANVYPAFSRSVIPDYATASPIHYLYGQGEFQQPDVGQASSSQGGLWLPAVASAINRVDIIKQTSAFKEGSIFRLYGTKVE